mmetsp:Transcript_96824/g.166955  ORF Transcript_96824/g.166955 Transcript_96824/m.166955 type:complete len:250 (-) Transcript_96824:2369-3118(-)
MDEQSGPGGCRGSVRMWQTEGWTSWVAPRGHVGMGQGGWPHQTVLWGWRSGTAPQEGLLCRTVRRLPWSAHWLSAPWTGGRVAGAERRRDMAHQRPQWSMRSISDRPVRPCRPAAPWPSTGGLDPSHPPAPARRTCHPAHHLQRPISWPPPTWRPAGAGQGSRRAAAAPAVPSPGAQSAYPLLAPPAPGAATLHCPLAAPPHSPATAWRGGGPPHAGPQAAVPPCGCGTPPPQCFSQPTAAPPAARSGC